MNSHSTLGGPALVQQRHLVTEIPGPISRELLERRQRSVARGLSHVLPVFATAAGGGGLIDVDGISLIDVGSGIAVTSVGNSAELVVTRATEQVAHFTHTCFMVVPYEGYVEVCEELNRVTPGTHDKRSALFNSGAEAVENAVKIARTARGHQANLLIDHADHGRTNLDIAMTAKNMPYKDGFGPFAGEVYRAPMAYPFRWPGGPARGAAEALDVVTNLIHTQVGENRTAAVVVEPIQGEGGFIVPPDGFLPGLAEYCRQHGIVFVADEIQSGFCRTGDWFACEHEGVVPDLVTTAKGIAGGLPLAAVTGRRDPGGQGLPRGRPDRAHLRDLRQRAALLAAAGDQRGTAGRGPDDPRGRVRGALIRGRLHQRELSAVHHKRRSVDERRVVGREKRVSGSDLVGAADPAERNVAGHVSGLKPLSAKGRPDGVGQRRADEAR